MVHCSLHTSACHSQPECVLLPGKRSDESLESQNSCSKCRIREGCCRQSSSRIYRKEQHKRKWLSISTAASTSNVSDSDWHAKHFSTNSSRGSVSYRSWQMINQFKVASRCILFSVDDKTNHQILSSLSHLTNLTLHHVWYQTYYIVCTLGPDNHLSSLLMEKLKW